MKNLMEYKGYFSIPRYNSEDNIFWGKLDGISDSISFEGASVEEFQIAFREAVDDYLDTCLRHNISPKPPFDGRFDVDVAPEIHERLAIIAADHDVSFNQVVETALMGYLSVAGQHHFA